MTYLHCTNILIIHILCICVDIGPGKYSKPKPLSGRPRGGLRLHQPEVANISPVTELAIIILISGKVGPTSLDGDGNDGDGGRAGRRTGIGAAARVRSVLSDPSRP